MSLYKILKNIEKPVSGKAILNAAAGHQSIHTQVVEKVTNEESYKSGYEQAKADMQVLLNKKVTEITGNVQVEAKNKYNSIFRSLVKKYRADSVKREKDTVELAMSVLKKLVFDKKMNEGIVRENIEEAIKHVTGREGVTIALSAADFAELSGSGFVKQIEEGFEGLKIVKDISLKAGDVVIETKFQTIDATISEKIKNAAEKIERGETITEDTVLDTVEGMVTEIVGNVIEVSGLECSVGDMCEIFTKDNKKKMRAEVVGYRDGKNLLMPLSEMLGVGPNSRVVDLKQPFEIGLTKELLGRVIDGLGNPIDNKSMLKADEKRSIYGKEISPFDRNRITEPLTTGVRAIDTMLTVGKGQRMGIFSGSGVGKSAMMGMMARNTAADVNVIALIGERGREVMDFIEKDLGEEGLKRSVVIAATSDKSPLERVHGALVATTIAEYFRDMGLSVLLMMDSVTRYATSLREIGLATGEPPSTKGFTPSVFTKLPKLLERSGNFAGSGSITAFYTVLVEGDDMNEPVADAVRGILDGHIVLSRKLAGRNHYPSIELTSSISRIMMDIVPEKQMKTAGKVKEVISTMQEMEDLINIGAYKKGANPKVDYARDVMENLNGFLKQGMYEQSDYKAGCDQLEKILAQGGKK
jgi:flagellum-specific ATP synthase